MSKATATIKEKAGNAYENFASSQPYQRVFARLRVIDLAAATLAAVATAYSNAFVHVPVIGWVAAVLLAVFIFCIVEGSTFVLEDGLREVFKGGTQRLLANFTYWTIRATMVLNAALLCCAIGNLQKPEWLLTWQHWSFVYHLGLALVLIPLIRNTDPVVAFRMLTLKAETAHEDLVVTRKSAAIGSSLALMAARMRGFFDTVFLSWHLLWQGQQFGKKYAAEVAKLSTSRFAFTNEAPTEWPSEIDLNKSKKS